MAGTFQAGTNKLLSGVYSMIQTLASAQTQGVRGIVAYPFTSDWGPINEWVPCTNISTFESKFNAKNTALTAKKIYTHAFKGLPAKVMGWRMGTSAAKKAQATLNDASAGVSLKLETLYPTDRAFVALVKDGVIAGTKVIQILEGTVVRAEFTGATVTELMGKLNVSDYVRVIQNGVLMPANTAGVTFTGGNNGSNVTATEYAAFLDALETDRTAKAFAFDAVTDDALLATAEEWTKRVQADGIRITFARGTSLNPDSDAVNVKSKALNHRKIINLGNGADGFSSAEIAIYIAARAAAVALNRTLTDETTPYLKINNPKYLKTSVREAARQNGTMLLVQNGSTVEIDEGVNTLTVPLSDSETVDMGKIRISNAVDQIVEDLEVFGAAYKKNKSNSPEARSAFAKAVETEYLSKQVRDEVIQSGATYVPDPDYYGPAATKTAKLYEAFFASNFKPLDSMDNVYQKLTVDFT